MAFQNRPAWAPASMRLSSPFTKSLGQSSDFFDSPLLSFTLTSWTALTAGYLGWGLSGRGNNWSTFWWVVAGVSSIKALHDLSLIGKKS